MAEYLKDDIFIKKSLTVWSHTGDTDHKILVLRRIHLLLTRIRLSWHFWGVCVKLSLRAHVQPTATHTVASHSDVHKQYWVVMKIQTGVQFSFKPKVSVFRRPFTNILQIFRERRKGNTTWLRFLQPATQGPGPFRPHCGFRFFLSASRLTCVTGSHVGVRT